MNFALGLAPPSAGGPGSGGSGRGDRGGGPQMEHLSVPGGAGRGGFSPMENLEKQLVCPVCLEVFSKPVVILPCQHNLCRKCANDIFQAANPHWQSRGPNMAAAGGRFRCPSCRHDVVLDRHGVYGLQRNLLVENIIDLYRQQEHSRPEQKQPEQQQQQQHLMCEEHDEERINIYCVSCQTPTCSLCKVFGKHKDCEVEPLTAVYTKQKAELSDGIAMLLSTNNHIQAVISQMEEACRTIEENGQRHRDQLGQRFGDLAAILDERKQELVGLISQQQDDKLKHVRALIRRHGDELEAAVTLVESAIQSMEEPHVPLFIQSATAILEKMEVTSRACNLERPTLGFESMNHLVVDTSSVADMLMDMDFCSGVGNDEEEDPDDESELDFYSRF